MTRTTSPVRRRLLGFAAAAATCWLVPRAVAGEDGPSKADWQAIKRAISEQLAAFKTGNGGKAFGYATPAIQAQFGDADNFLAMVRGAYAPLIEARYTEFLEGAVIEGVVVQPLRLIAHDNTVRVALYTVEKRSGRWRISGCMIAPSTVQAA
jgi:hypothetical protein